MPLECLFGLIALAFLGGCLYVVKGGKRFGGW